MNKRQLSLRDTYPDYQNPKLLSLSLCHSYQLFVTLSLARYSLLLKFYRSCSTIQCCSTDNQVFKLFDLSDFLTVAQATTWPCLEEEEEDHLQDAVEGGGIKVAPLRSISYKSLICLETLGMKSKILIC
ncbi:hypothetical protein P8452_62111 [Trifolium repens]|nr:hypothetical protein P8452_62111 [Trifolium repens]